MKKMSYKEGTLDKHELYEELRVTTKPVYYSYGGFASPLNTKIQISRAKAMQLVLDKIMLEAEEDENGLYLLGETEL